MKKTVLVVDDEREIVDFLAKFLARFNLSVVKAFNGNQALESVRQQVPDCIFLDLQMPDKDGLEVLRELQQISPEQKVIMITAQGEKNYRQEAQKYGVVDYITKPLDLMELQQKVEEYVV